jgi:GT2 family glycosyltransferase
MFALPDQTRAEVIPIVHVILLNWNGLSDTVECLRSLQGQTYPNLTRWVVDNGSDRDEAAEIARLFPDVHVIRAAANLGFCEGNNVGIRAALAAGADYVLLLNNDTIAPPELVEQLVGQSQSLPDVGAVSPLILRDPMRETIWFCGSRWDRKLGGFRHTLAGRPVSACRDLRPQATDWACGCCLLAPAAVVRKIGLLDPRYFAYGDEQDWCSRMRRCGYQCCVIPSVRLYHKVSRSAPGIISAYLSVRNRLLWMHDHLSWRARIRPYVNLAKEFCCLLGGLFGVQIGRVPFPAERGRAVLYAWRDYLLGRYGRWPSDLIPPRATARRTVPPG